MSTVWAIEQGEYSDYRVVGVFSTEANARLVAEAIGSDATVSEWSIDPVVDDLNAGRSPYLVNMLKDGSVERCEKWTISGYELAGTMRIWKRSEAPAYVGKNIPDCLHGTVWASDTMHAIKIVNEKRAQMIASGEWR
jgi:hypothetical protein